MTGKKHILVMRFSAMGDVAMTVPVIKELLQQHPDLKITYVSRPAFAAFFEGIDRLQYVKADFKAEYSGFTGTLKLFRYLKTLGPYDALANLHNNLRTNLLQALFKLSGISGQQITKGRQEKKLLTRFPNKVLKPLRSIPERYADVFRQLGFSLTLSGKLGKSLPAVNTFADTKNQPWIGISPFAQHKGKIYPLGRMEQVIEMLNRSRVKIFVFGGLPYEKAIADEWEQKYASVTSVIDRMDMKQELDLITQLDVMLAMDSAGMHMASLVGTPVVSVWGATHHYAGFLGYGQTEDNIVADDIACRPCSVYGNKPCFRGDYACLYNIHPQDIASKLLALVSL
ncbi:glycosyltransferase family 9 protein [Mucilaginibacter sp. PAMB04274]|uniref:glycosyltransferase family 9 protein n=1 Tax=Mucilaginibacter sp. PAMB04274 TaxID=3138568 RepID=UPI0031F5F5EB